MKASEVSPDNPARLRRVSDDTEVRVTDPAEYQNLTQTAGYRDVTDERGGSGRGGGRKQATSSAAASSDSSGSSSS